MAEQPQFAIADVTQSGSLEQKQFVAMTRIPRQCRTQSVLLGAF